MKYLILLLIFLSLFNCSSYKEKEYINKIVHEWKNKKIIFPEYTQVKILGKDTICSDLQTKNIKILIYIDSIGCTACKLNFYDWNEKIKSLSDINDLVFLFYIHSKDYKNFTNTLKGEGFNYPIFYDTQNKLATTNHFPKDQRFNTFLLNNENKVQLIGNPLGNKGMWELYIKEIKHLCASLQK